MPQKRNADAAELVRGKTGRVIGALTGLLVMLKGLPLTFNKDMQEDKEPLFDATETLLLAIAAMAGMVADMKVDKKAMLAATSGGFITATDLADWLVRKAGLPFREAHHVTGRLVKLAEERGQALGELPLEAMRKIDPRVSRDVYTVLGVAASVKSRTSPGGAAPANVRRACRQARARFLKPLGRQA
jgi:argininosuccinate lyase